TDIPSLMLRGGGNRTVYLRFVDKINNAYLAYFSHYVFLTDPMNELVNKHNKPYIVMEGLADVKMATKKVAIITKKEPNILMYAGGLHEKYGLKLLVEAFMRVDKRDWNLVIYG